MAIRIRTVLISWRFYFWVLRMESWPIFIHFVIYLSFTNKVNNWLCSNLPVFKLDRFALLPILFIYNKYQYFTVTQYTKKSKSKWRRRKNTFGKCHVNAGQSALFIVTLFINFYFKFLYFLKKWQKKYWKRTRIYSANHKFQNL